MKMHPKPLIRHSAHVEDVSCRLLFDPYNETNGAYAVEFCRTKDGATQRLVMHEHEAADMAIRLLQMIHRNQDPR